MKFLKEPIKSWKLWLVLSVLFILSVPWYLPSGSYNPIILGLPYWVWIVIFVSLAISSTLTYALKKLWISYDTSDEGGDNHER